MTKTIVYENIVDKSDWGEGPWQTEPDKKQYQDEETGLPCLIVRGPLGALCGYVGVDNTHKFFERDFDDVDCDINVHGGLTYADKCQEALSEKDHCHTICHIPEKGEDDNIWWFGFDCAHSGDLCPYRHFKNAGDIYRDFKYVENEIKKLAKQLADIK